MKDKILNYKKLGLIFVFILGMAVSGAIGGLIRNCDMGQLIPLTEMDLKDMGKAEFNIQLSAKDEEFIKDSNGFINSLFVPNSSLCVMGLWQCSSLLFKYCMVSGYAFNRELFFSSGVCAGYIFIRI